MSSSILTNLAHEQYFGFAQRPFALSPDPKFLYRSASHDAAIGRLLQALRRKEGFLVLTGDIGTGKTTLSRALLSQMEPTSFTSLVLNPFLSLDELLRQVLLDFGIVSREAAHFDAASTHELVSTLHEFLQSIASIGGTAILIIDEAQHLSKRVLEQIRVLSNLEANDTKLVQIVLIGQLNLMDTLSHADMRQLAQRISLRATLSALTREETDAYVRYRLAVAAPTREVVFGSDAMAGVYAISEGVPRVINLLCDRALAFAAQDSESTVTAPHVRHAAEALVLTAPPGTGTLGPFSWPQIDKRSLLAVGIALAVVAVAIGVTLWLRPLPTWVEAPVQPALPARPAVRIQPGTPARELVLANIHIPRPPVARPVPPPVARPVLPPAADPVLPPVENPAPPPANQ